ncbi:MAG TPA: hypothetical protein VFM48_01465, partial [Aquabacterium sp.]|nr:hypothetical protein [Aquabacterium sp.]
MTIQFLAQWNGYESGSVQTLSTSEESRLIAAGIARQYARGMDGGKVKSTGLAKRYSQRLMNAPALATIDTTSFRWIEAVPFTGKKFVRVKYENDTTSAWVGTMATAVAGGRAFADDNPVNAAGANPTWTVTSGLAVPA